MWSTSSEVYQCRCEFWSRHGSRGVENLIVTDSYLSWRKMAALVTLVLWWSDICEMTEMSTVHDKGHQCIYNSNWNFFGSGVIKMVYQFTTATAMTLSSLFSQSRFFLLSVMLSCSNLVLLWLYSVRNYWRPKYVSSSVDSIIILYVAYCCCWWWLSTANVFFTKLWKASLCTSKTCSLTTFPLLFCCCSAIATDIK